MVNKALTSCRNTNTKVQIIGNRIIVHIHIGTRSNQRDPFWCLLQWEIVSRVCIVCMCVHVFLLFLFHPEQAAYKRIVARVSTKGRFLLDRFKYRQIFYAFLSIAWRDFCFVALILSLFLTHPHYALVSLFRTSFFHIPLRNRAWSFPFLYQFFSLFRVFYSTHSRVLSRPFFISLSLSLLLSLDLFFPDSYAQKHCSALSRMLRYLYICICIYIYKNTKNNLQNDIISILHASFIFVSHICFFFLLFVSSFPFDDFMSVCVWVCESVCVSASSFVSKTTRTLEKMLRNAY